MRKLKGIRFHLLGPSTTVTGIADSLKKISSERHLDFKHIIIYLKKSRSGIDPGDSKWKNLDNSLVRLWESHNIQVKVICDKEVVDQGQYLFPEMLKTGHLEISLLSSQ